VKGLKSEVTPVEHPGREPGSTGQGGQKTEVGGRRTKGEGRGKSKGTEIKT